MIILNLVPIVRCASALLHSQSGNFGMLAALIMLPLIAAAGIAIDFASALNRKNAMQSAADAAALAGAAAGTGSEQTVAHGFLGAHLGSNNATNPKAPPDWTHQVTIERDTVAVVVREDYKTAVMHIFGYETLPISVYAKAVRKAGASACVLILDPSKSDALRISNSNSVINECGFQVNSLHSQRAFYMENQGKFSASHIAVAGQSKLSGTMISPQPKDGSPVVPDPLAGMAEPVARGAACTSKSLKTINSQGKTSLEPGVYCGGLTVNATDDLTLKPGIYTFRGGAFTLNTSAKVIGKDVQFYFEDAQSPLMLNGAAVLQVSAPTSGTHAGILMFQGRQAKDSSVQFRINTSAGSFYNGAIYLPYAVIDWNVSGSLNSESSFTALITKVLNLYVSGTTYFKKPTAAGETFAQKGLAGTGGVRLVE
ncbi:TadE/TadG family type IV pilus assembly protein [Ensifer sp.]|jgi:Flp pilus assembly protein TadG|uniref:TadE/TadG family type IV pilus assembly protein n=1 Tax=Ensifer sp. TaxID=1872086 RepID=UPI002E151F85|nr:pilus assembly protein TadG-related protein [Ensifer sp.]